MFNSIKKVPDQNLKLIYKFHIKMFSNIIKSWLNILMAINTYFRSGIQKFVHAVQRNTICSAKWASLSGRVPCNTL